MEDQGLRNKEISRQKAGQVDIVYYTDPLCCWSWAFEPHWRRLLAEHEGKISWRYCMGGLIPSWKDFNDTLNSVTRPIQMGPVWMHAGQVGGVTIRHRIWMEDPPASSYPSCIAFKSVELQSFDAADRYLTLLREAVMLEGFNIAKTEVLLSLAEKLAEETEYPFNLKEFEEDLTNDRGLEAFRKDVNEVNQHNLNRFPTLIIRKPGEPARVMTGYRTFEAGDALIR